jgi:hypothetical protein
MRFNRRVNQYWPITVLAGALVLGIPLLGIRAEIQGTAALVPRGFQEAALITVELPTLAEHDLPDTQALAFVHATIVPFNQLSVAKKLKQAGQRIGVRLTEKALWTAGSYSAAKAAHIFAVAKRAGIEKVADFIVIGAAGEDVLSIARQAERRKMYELAKQYFANTPVAHSYGPMMLRAEDAFSQAHPAGGLWTDYRFGPDECDVAVVDIPSVSVARLDQLAAEVSLLRSRSPGVQVLVSLRAEPGEPKRDSRTPRRALASGRSNLDQAIEQIVQRLN